MRAGHWAPGLLGSGRGDVRAFSLDKALEFDATFLEDDDHQHDSAIQALGVKLHGALSQEKLNLFFGEVLCFGPEVLRLTF